MDFKASCISKIEFGVNGGVKWICVAVFLIKRLSDSRVLFMTSDEGRLKDVCV